MNKFKENANLEKQLCGHNSNSDSVTRMLSFLLKLFVPLIQESLH